MKIVGLMILLGAVGGLLLILSRDKGERRWYQQVAPPESAIEILGYTERYSSTTFFRTEGGVYACEAEWERARPCSKVAKIPDPSKLCKPVGTSVPPTPGEVADSLKVACPGGDGFFTFDLVLLKDGRAFESERDYGGENLVVFAFCFYGGIVGLIVGIIIVVARWARMKRRSVV